MVSPGLTAKKEPARLGAMNRCLAARSSPASRAKLSSSLLIAPPLSHIHPHCVNNYFQLFLAAPSNYHAIRSACPGFLAQIHPKLEAKSGNPPRLVRSRIPPAADLPVSRAGIRPSMRTPACARH